MLDRPPPPVVLVGTPRRAAGGAETAWWRRPAAVRAGIAAWAGFCVLLLFCGAMTRPVTYDEDQYVAAAVMAWSHLPYADFAYLQPPLYPLALAPVMALASGWYVLAARTVSFVLALGSGMLLWHLVRRLGAGPMLAMVLLTACLSSPFLIAPLANARNDGLPLLLLLAGLSVHVWAEARGNEDARAAPPALLWAARFAAALLFGLAAETKLSYLFAPAALGVHALFAPRRRLVPALLGVVAATLPAASFLVVAREEFLFGTVHYHLIAPAAWYADAGLSDLLRPWAKLRALADDVSFGGNLTLVSLALGLCLVAMARRRKWKRPGRMLLALTGGAGVLAFQPAPSWPMYYAALAPLLACCIAHLDRVTTHVAGPARKQVLVLAAALPMVPVLGLQVLELPKLLDRTNWIGFIAHRNAQAVRDAVAANGTRGGQVATLFPLYVIDANPVRLDLATGPFVFRSGASLAPGSPGVLHALTPGTLDAAFDADPPDAVYAGLYADAWPVPMDAPLIAYAERRHWPLVRTDALGGRLWVRPRE